MIEEKQIEDLWKQGFELAQEYKKYDEAIIYYKRVLDLDPAHIKALNSLGAAKAHMNKYDEAISYYKKALKIDKNFEKSLFNMGVALAGLHKYEEAIIWYKKLLRINNKSEGVNYNLGNSYLKLGRYEEALKHYELELNYYSNEWARINKRFCLQILKNKIIRKYIRINTSLIQNS